MNFADFIVDVGPKAGIHGGHLVAEGNIDQIKKNKKSITGKYLSGKEKIDIRKKRTIDKNRIIEVKGAEGNNLKKVNAEFPIGKFICVTGVSGSGKSTLLFQTLYRAINRLINNSQSAPMKYKSIDGLHLIDKVININQSPIGRTPRSNPATYTCLLYTSQSPRDQ